ncbi:MAG: dienelactone hydrolase [Pedosphaera sp.]|nr:dienelactone hydrolase [Pedosphaera sp.]MSU44352.1 dienelactone hydrolase [Pedosphaera sp.]
MKHPIACCAAAVALWTFAAGFLMAQTEPSNARNWLRAAPPVPAFNVPATLPEWKTQRAAVRVRLNELLGEMPPRPKPAAVRILQREDRGDHWLEKFQFDNGAGATVPGYLLLPKTATAQKKAPGILYCHWHGGQYRVGKDEVFATNATPVAAGPALVRQGYVVIAVDAYCFGERNGQGPGGVKELDGGGEMTAAKFQLWMGRTLWGMMLRDDLSALDILAARPEVDAARIGVTGISMGATRAWWLMALDERLKAGVAVCCLTRYQNLIEKECLRCHGIYYFVPGMLRHFDSEAVVALAAPRALLFQSGEDDLGSPVEGIKLIEEKVRPAYRLHGKSDDFQSIIYPRTGHVYTPAMWEKTVAWLDKHLR